MASGTRAAAQSASSTPQAEIVVVGQRNEAIVDVESSLDETQIEGYAADSIAGLMQRIAPLIGGTDDQPVLIVNGEVIADPKEIERYPPEALKRVEVLTREGAPKYGFPSGKRIVNLVLKSRFKSYIAGLEAHTIAELDGDSEALSFQRVAIRGDDRWSADVALNRAGAVLRSDRGMPSQTGDASLAGNLFGIDGQELDPALSALAGTTVTSAAVPAIAGTGPLTIGDLLPGANEPTTGDDGHFRSLSPATFGGSFNFSYTKKLGETSLTTTLHAKTQETSQQIGLATASLDLPPGSIFLPLANGARLDRLFEEGRLGSSQRSTASGISVSAIRRLLGVNAVLNLSYDRSDSNTLTDQGYDLSVLQGRILANDPSVNPFGALPLRPPSTRQTTSSSETWSGSLALRDRLKLLPAGTASWAVTATMQLARSHSRTSSTGNQLVIDDDFNSRESDLRLDLNLPVTNEKAGALSLPGQTSLTLSADVSAASRTDARVSLTGGAFWSPSKDLTLTGTFNLEKAPPTNAQLYAPVLDTPNVGVFDYRSGGLVYVSETTGGNPDLRSGRTTSLALGLTATPLGSRGPRINVDYANHVSRNGIGTLPPLSEIVESLFPDRVDRASDGQLISLDMRPLNYARDVRRNLGTGLSWRTNLRTSDRELRRQKSDPTRWRGPESIEFSLRHEWELASSLLLRTGLPRLDRLRGGGGGEGRHKVQAQLLLNLRGIGINVATVWQSGYPRLTGTDGPNPNDLRFGALLKTDVEIDLYPTSFAFLKTSAVMKDTRVAITIDNLFDRRRSVSRLDGSELAGYSKYDLDPFGRILKISLRRRF